MQSKSAQIFDTTDSIQNTNNKLRISLIRNISSLNYCKNLGTMSIILTDENIYYKVLDWMLKSSFSWVLPALMAKFCCYVGCRVKW